MKKLFLGVVASVKPASVSELWEVLSKIKGVTSIEVRLDERRMMDYSNLLELPEFCRSVGKPVILTLRALGQGGSNVITTEAHFDFWNGLPPDLKSMICNEECQVFVDWDLELLGHCSGHKKPQIFPWHKVGASWHDFQSTPQNLFYVMRAIEEFPARAFLKMVATAQNPGAVARIKALFQNRTDPRPLIAFAMGEHGRQSRFDCLGWGSAATFGRAPGSPPTAAGQPLVDELFADPSVRRVLQSEGY